MPNAERTFFKTPPEGTPLTPRERQIAALIAEGNTNAEIAVELTLSRETIKTHCRRIMSKLGARTRTHAIALCYQKGWLTTNSMENSRDRSDSSLRTSGHGWRPSPDDP